MIKTCIFRFGPEDVIEKLKDKGKELGLVIDITYTDKYYHKGVSNLINKKIGSANFKVTAHTRIKTEIDMKRSIYSI